MCLPLPALDKDSCLMGTEGVENGKFSLALLIWEQAHKDENNK